MEKKSSSGSLALVLLAAGALELGRELELLAACSVRS
jgi:hypothetical protein